MKSGPFPIISQTFVSDWLGKVTHWNAHDLIGNMHTHERNGLSTPRKLPGMFTSTASTVYTIAARFVAVAAGTPENYVCSYAV